MQSELERLPERVRELEVENEGLRQSEQTVATEQETLQHVATQLINAPGMQSLYDQIVHTAVAITHSDFASIQMFYSKRGTSGELRLLGHPEVPLRGRQTLGMGTPRDAHYLR
jgi:hypothetical protein